jgi:hypothetical protein
MLASSAADRFRRSPPRARISLGNKGVRPYGVVVICRKCKDREAAPEGPEVRCREAAGSELGRRRSPRRGCADWSRTLAAQGRAFARGLDIPRVASNLRFLRPRPCTSCARLSRESISTAGAWFDFSDYRPLAHVRRISS